MAKVIYDQYGRRPGDRHYGNNANPPLVHIADESTAGVTYLCFFGTAARAIHRVTETAGITTLERAWGAWADRATLTYTPINDYIEVTE